MKRFISIIAVFAMTFVMASAQTVEGSRLFNNVYVTVEGGAITPMVSDGFWGNMRPTVGFEVGKNVTPVVGFSLEAIGYINTTGANTWFDQSNLVGNVKFNLSNLFGGYKGYPRRVEFQLVPGLGWGHNYGFTDATDVELNDVLPLPEDTYRNYLTYNAYGQIDFNLGKKRALQINVKPGVTWVTGSPNVGFYKDCASYNLRVGLTWKFGYKNTKGNKTHNFTVVPVPYFSQQEVDDAVAAALAKVEPKVVEKVVETEVVKTVVETKTVEVKPTLNPTFEQGRNIVDATSLSYLDVLADEMKSTDKNYTLTGYASLEGSEAFNEKLSLKRAEAIKKCLIDRGVDASRLTAVAGGATDKFGPRYEQNRIVVVE